MKRSLRTLGTIFLSSLLIHSQHPAKIPDKTNYFNVVTIYNSYEDFQESKATQGIQKDVQNALEAYRTDHPNTLVRHHTYNLANDNQPLHCTQSNPDDKTPRPQKTLEYLLNYHTHTPIDKVILAFHGSKESITTHARYNHDTIESYKLNAQDIASFSIKPHTFEKNAEILLLSCQAAKGEANVTQALADVIKKPVQACPHSYFGTIIYDRRKQDLALASKQTSPSIGPLTSSFYNPATQDTILLQLGEPYLFNKTQDTITFAYIYTKTHLQEKNSYQEYIQTKKLLKQEFTLLEEDLAQSKFIEVRTVLPHN